MQFKPVWFKGQLLYNGNLSQNVLRERISKILPTRVLNIVGRSRCEGPYDCYRKLLALRGGLRSQGVHLSTITHFGANRSRTSAF